MLVTILVIVLIIALIGGLPHWPYAAAYPNAGYYPSGVIGLVLLIVLILLLVGHL